jgi:peptidyl-tRNA hydrolase
MSIVTPSHQLNIFLLSPVSYMNIIGKNVAKATKSEKIDKASLIVLHDDLEQKLGRIRLVKGTSFK